MLTPLETIQDAVIHGEGRGRRLMTLPAVADGLSVSLQFVRNLVNTGQLKAVRLGAQSRVDPADYAAFIQNRKTHNEQH